tara:strand:- start:10854 stop:11000 length:147 start_codon:yes stop_codon:yes gene_type:complete
MKIKHYIAILTSITIGCNSVSQKEEDIYKYLEATIVLSKLKKANSLFF